MMRLKLFRKSLRKILLILFITVLYIFFLDQWNTVPKSIGNNSLGYYQLDTDSTQKSITHKQTVKPVNVILIASWRSGSSFTGQLFNMHDDIFYLFEPLRFLGQEKVKQAETTKVLETMYKCDFTNSLLNTWIEETNNDILHRVSSNALIKLCPTEITQGAKPGPCNRRKFKQCPDLTPENVTQTCQSHPYKFFKVIKLTDITFLEKLVRKYNLKIIHLVRDPRGIHFSRKNTFDERYVMSNKLFGMHWTCRHVNEIIKLWDSETKWLLGNYKRVRFEDLSLQPMEAAREVYDFLQIPFTQRIQQWIVENTIRKNQTQSNPCEHKNHKLNKKSSDVAHAWRMYSNLSTVLEIQKTCAETMQSLGYVNVYTEQQLQDVHFPVMKSREEIGV
ncbi:carbohydrate sulfotransferase 1-like [Antedon mediterranea]|uniref:carbohydrate sulfotransferase 1-like n=1 Tax=Antedon mediterranea TaxID=105859 RepID=UPI003AF671BF